MEPRRPPHQLVRPIARAAFSMLSLFALLVPAVASADINTGLIAHYKFEGNANDSVGPYDGQWEGSEDYGSGVVGANAARFDGINSYIALPEPIPEQSQITIAAWINLQTTDRTNLWAAYCGPDGDGGMALTFASQFQTGRATFFVGRENNCTTRGSKSLVEEDRVITQNQWHHIAAVYEAGQRMSLYVDGVLVDEKTMGVPSSYLELTPYIGTDPRPSNAGRYYNWKGLIDDLRIYGRALTPTDIGELEDNSSAGNTDIPFVDTFGYFNTKHAGTNTVDFNNRSQGFIYTNSSGTNGVVEVYAPSATSSGAINAYSLDSANSAVLAGLEPHTEVCGWGADSAESVIGRCAEYAVESGKSLQITVSDSGYADDGPFPITFRLKPESGQTIVRPLADWHKWSLNFDFWSAFHSTVINIEANRGNITEEVNRRQRAIRQMDTALTMINLNDQFAPAMASIINQNLKIETDLANEQGDVGFVTNLSVTLADALSSCAPKLVSPSCYQTIFVNFASGINYAAGIIDLLRIEKKYDVLFVARKILEEQVGDNEDWLSDADIKARAETVASETDTGWLFDPRDVVHQYRLHQLSMTRWILSLKERLSTGIDVTPDDFFFSATTNENLSTEVVAGPVRITGIDVPAAWEVVGGEASISSNPLVCGTEWDRRGLVSNGEYLCIRQTTSDQLVTASTAYLVIGRKYADFIAFTKSWSSNPSNIALSLTDQTSQTVTLRADVFGSGASSMSGTNGTVVFTDNGRFLGSVETKQDLSSSQNSSYASLTVPLTSTDRAFRAAYIGNDGYEGSVSTTISIAEADLDLASNGGDLDDDNVHNDREDDICFPIKKAEDNFTMICL